MTDAISRSAVLENIYKMDISDCTDVEDIIDKAYAMIADAPALDAVPVVRCKDCRYSEPMKKHGVYRFGENALNCTQCRGDDGYGYAGISVIHPDDYCSDGALKDGEDT